MTKRLCRNCEQRKDDEILFDASRKGGGSYNRAQRSYRSTICLDCVGALAPSWRPGALSVSNWDAGILRLITERHIDTTPWVRVSTGERVTSKDIEQWADVRNGLYRWEPRIPETATITK